MSTAGQKAYAPNPIDTSGVTLPEELTALTEKLAASNHDNWARGRQKEGWTYGPARNDELKQHPGLVPYGELSETEKEYDRVTAMETLKAIYALGYRIVPNDAG
jgi:hypothetical protein